jgi:hypothetical protein
MLAPAIPLLQPTIGAFPEAVIVTVEPAQTIELLDAMLTVGVVRVETQSVLL